MIYSEKMIQYCVKHFYKPSWLTIGNSQILQYMINKFSTPFLNTENIIFINFSKKNLNYININNKKAFCIAVVENKNEKRSVTLFWNKNNEFFDSVFTVDEFIKWLEKNEMKFDKIIMNPPYNGNSNLYGKITLEAKKHSKEVVCLSPYLNYLETVQKQSVKNIANQLLLNLYSYELVKDIGFDAHFDKELCIFYFKDNVEQPADINAIYWNQFNNPRLTKSIINKIKSYNNFCYEKIISKKNFDKYEFKVAFTGVRGHCVNGIKQWDWTTILDEDKMKNFNYSSLKKEDLMGIPFNNEFQCKNFVDFANGDIFGYLILIQKHSINMDKWLFKLIPYLDFSKNWSDKDQCKEFHFTDDEYNYIKEEMKNFGWKTRK